MKVHLLSCPASPLIVQTSTIHELGSDVDNNCTLQNHTETSTFVIVSVLYFHDSFIGESGALQVPTEITNISSGNRLDLNLLIFDPIDIFTKLNAKKRYSLSANGPGSPPLVCLVSSSPISRIVRIGTSTRTTGCLPTCQKRTCSVCALLIDS